MGVSLGRRVQPCSHPDSQAIPDSQQSKDQVQEAHEMPLSKETRSAKPHSQEGPETPPDRSAQVRHPQPLNTSAKSPCEWSLT